VAQAPEVTDGRLARGERTRVALADALIALLEDGDPQPTARNVAARAGVSLRLVFHHFADMEQVLRAAVAIQVERHWRGLHPVDPSLPRQDRIDRTVRRFGALFDDIAPVRRASALYEFRSPTLRDEMAHSRRLLRRALARTFASEIEAAGKQASELLDQLEVAASFETWDQLRWRMGAGAAKARRLTARMISSAIDSALTNGGSP
jgi:TetR/AcrR family transcriptional regulator of autoinduction and epiphytic fitness